MVSPGGETQSGANVDAVLVMIVTYEYDANLRDQVPGDGFIFTCRNGIVGRLKDEPFASMQVEGKLTGPVPFEGMRSSGAQVGHVGNGSQVGQTGAELAAAQIAKFFLHASLLFAEGLQVGGGKFYVHFRHPL